MTERYSIKQRIDDCDDMKWKRVSVISEVLLQLLEYDLLEGCEQGIESILKDEVILAQCPEGLLPPYFLRYMMSVKHIPITAFPSGVELLKKWSKQITI